MIFVDYDKCFMLSEATTSFPVFFKNSPLPTRLFLYLLTALLCCTAQAAFGQTNTTLLDKFSRYQHYTMEQGLSNNWVTDVAQDDDGFMWFSTAEGLNRFDGERFTPFFYRADGKGLPVDRVSKLLALSNHRLLVGTEKGLCVLHTRLLEFENVLLPKAPESKQKDQRIFIIHRARNGQIWVATNTGVYVLDEQTHLLQSYLRPAEPNEISGSTFALDFLEFPDGTMAVKFRQAPPPYLTPWQVIDFQQQKTESLAQRLPGCGVLDTAFQINCTAWDGQNSIYYTAISTKFPVALSRFDWADRSTHALLQNQQAQSTNSTLGQFNHPFLLPDSLLLLQRYFGPPLLYNLRDGSTTDLPTWKTSVPDGKGIVNFVDRDGNLWLCPRFEGIYLLTLKNLPATAMTALNDAHRDMMKKTGVSEEWFGFIGIENAGRWTISSGNGGLYSLDKDSLGVTGRVFDNPFKSYAYVHDFAPDRGDTLWTNTLGGLYWYDPVHNTNGPLKERYAGLDSLDDRFIYRDRHGLIWGRVRNNGVCYFDTRSRRLVHFPSKGVNAVFPLVSATVCTETPDGDMWFSYGQEEKYLVHWQRATGVFEKIQPITPPGTIVTKAFDILADPHGNLWLYTNQRWYVMDIRSRQTTAFGKENGLITNDPDGLCFDRDGNVWFATPYGLSRYDPRSRQMRTFYQTDGLLSNTISNVELIDTVHNILFVSTDRGLCLFEPDRVGAAAPAPPTLITGLRVSDQPVAFPHSGVLALRYYQNDLRIEFTCVNFTNGSKSRYQYSMEPEGRAANWKEAGIDNFASFLNLAPGRYTFQARTANSDGVWGNEAARLSIVIYPPWWGTWTFRLSILAALAALGWGLYRRQIGAVEDRGKGKSPRAPANG